MTKNHSDKKIEDRGEILLDTTNQYIKNERSKNESENILNIVGEKLKSRTKAFTKKVKDNDKDFNIEFYNEKKQGNLY